MVFFTQLLYDFIMRGKRLWPNEFDGDVGQTIVGDEEEIGEALDEVVLDEVEQLQGIGLVVVWGQSSGRKPAPSVKRW